MEQNLITARLATSIDLEALLPIFKTHSERMNLNWDFYQDVAKKILSHTDFGLVVIAEQKDQGKNLVKGFMMFTYEWSDWRDGIFFWV